MSFSLAFTPRRAESLDAEQLAAFAKSNRHFAEGFGNYHNEATGVYFTLSIEAGALNADINYNRPTFFGAEALEVLGALCGELELDVSNPQDAPAPAAFDADALLASYIAGNTAAARALAAVNVARPPVMARSDSLALWRYRKVKAGLERELEEEMGEQYVVPELVAVAHGGRALRVAFMPRPTFYVVPPVDLLMFKRGEATGVARAADILERIGALFVPLTHHPELRMSTEMALFEGMDEWDAALDSVPLAFAAADLKRLALDGFIDE